MLSLDIYVLRPSKITLKCTNIDLSGKGKEDPDIDISSTGLEISNVEDSKKKETKDAVALKSTDLLNSVDHPVSEIFGFQKDEEPIKTICYWSNIKGNSYREKETHSETSIEPTDIDLEQNKRFVEWLLNEIAKGNKEIFFDKVLGENILKNGGIVCEKYMEKKRELFC